MSERLDDRAESWSARPWIMAAICALAGLCFHKLTQHAFEKTVSPLRLAAATFVAIATLSFVLTVERQRRLWALGFASGWGLVIALVGWFTAQYSVDPTIFEWPYLSGLLAVMIAAPLFQTIRDEGRWALPYQRLHDHAWADAVIGASSLLFTGIVFLLAWLIAGLFGLIGIDQVRKVLEKDWFSWMLSGFAFGGSVGLLRERDRLLPTIQRLVMLTLGVLAPPLALALVLFLASIPFTGLDEFWKSGVPPTPLLLLAGAGAILLANSVIGNKPKDGSNNSIMRWAALLLVAVILPLALIAALSIGTRIGQYGWTPERMWGVVAVGVAISYGLAGWYSIWRGRRSFDRPLRPLQTALALGLCGIALFLALPILDFGAISARSQIDRLNSGKIQPSKFDWTAMAFDFGPAGRARLEEIAKHGPQDQRAIATTALNAKNRWNLARKNIEAGPVPTEITVLPANVTVPDDLRTLLIKGTKAEEPFCSTGGACRVYPQSRGTVFVAFMDGCVNLPPQESDDPKSGCERTPGVFELRNGKWVNLLNSPIAEMSLPDSTRSERQVLRNALDRGDVRVVPVDRRQIAVGGKAVSDDF